MIAPAQMERIIEIFKPYHPEKIGIFGSVSREESTPQSDIDILYKFSRPISLFQKFDIQQALEQSLNIRVDLVSEDFLHPLLKDQIQKDLKIIYGG